MATGAALAAPVDVVRALHAPCEAIIGNDGRFYQAPRTQFYVPRDLPRIATKVASCGGKNGKQTLATKLSASPDGPAHLQSRIVALNEEFTCKNGQLDGAYRAVIKESGWPSESGRRPEWNVTATFVQGRLHGETVVRAGRSGGPLCRSLKLQAGELTGVSKFTFGSDSFVLTKTFKKGVVDGPSTQELNGKKKEVQTFVDGRLVYTDLYDDAGRRYRRNEHRSEFEWSHVNLYGPNGNLTERLTMAQYSAKYSPRSSRPLSAVAALTIKRSLLATEPEAQFGTPAGVLLHGGLMPCSDGICVGPFVSVGIEGFDGQARATTYDVSGLIFVWYAYLHGGVGYRRVAFEERTAEGWQITAGGGFTFLGAYVRHAQLPNIGAKQTEFAATLTIPIVFR